MNSCEWIATLSETNVIVIVLRLLLTVLLCGAIGMERGLRNRPAGFITYILVGCGSTLIMITNQFISQCYQADPTRMAAQVVSGIGFLGAGTIITTTKNEVRGLTTAAGLWATAAIGLAVGIGFYSAAILGCLVIMISLTWLKKIDIYIKTHAKSMEIYLEYDETFSMQHLYNYGDMNGYELFDLEIGKLKTLAKDLGTLSFSIDLKRKENHAAIIEKISRLNGITYIREIA